MNAPTPLPTGGARAVRLDIDSRLDHVELLARAVSALCATAGMRTRECARVELALVEAANNVIRHAYRGEAGHPVRVDVTLGDGLLTLRLEDEGLPMPERPSPALDYDPGDVANLPEGGMGLFIIHSVMDNVEFRRERDRNALVMTRRNAA